MISGSDEWFSVSGGTRQGAIESPPAFVLFFDFVVKIACHQIDAEFPEGAGLDLNFSMPHILRPPRGSTQSRTLCGRELVLALLYADDLTALTKSSAVAKRVLEILVATCKRFGLYASFKKTFSQVFKSSVGMTRLRCAVSDRNFTVWLKHLAPCTVGSCAYDAQSDVRHPISGRATMTH